MLSLGFVCSAKLQLNWSSSSRHRRMGEFEVAARGKISLLPLGIYSMIHCVTQSATFGQLREFSVMK